MTKIIDGRKAEITEKGRRFTTYREFAAAHGYPEAAAKSDSSDSREKLENGDIVTLLTSGPHLTGYPGSTLWIVEAANGERHIINEVGLCIMPAEIHGVTLLPDEALGGTLREYREVNREAAAGETVIMTEATGTRRERGREVPDYHNGDIFVIDHISGSLAASTSGKLFYHREYSVLEPTDILVIKTDEPRGKRERFRLVDRKAAVGERVIIVNDRSGSGGSDGEFFRVGNVGVYCVDGDAGFNGCGNSYVLPGGKWFVNTDAYAVLEPVESAAPTPLLSAQPAESQAAANIASLALRLTQAEAKITALERKVASGPVDKCERAALPSFTYEMYRKAAAISVKTPQMIRDEIVERAKADVSDLLGRDSYPVTTVDGQSRAMNKYAHYVDYVVNLEKRTVAAIVRHKDGGKVRVVGKSKCAPGETFNAHIGRAIALHRALGLTVPAEYLDAPGPTEVRVGDAVTFDSVKELGTVYVVTSLSRHGQNLRIITDEIADMVGKGAYGDDLNDGETIILDDSREDGDSAASSPRKEAA